MKSQDSTPSALPDSDSPEDIEEINRILGTLDEIIRMRKGLEQQDKATSKDRLDLVRLYRLLQQLKEKRNGRFLIEYSEGMTTFLEEVIL